VTRGVIAAGDPQTVAAGVEMLRRGGNAVDAAVAAAFASVVTEAVLINIGGSGLALIVDSSSNQRVVYDFLSTMPSGKPRGNMDFHQVWVDFGQEKQPFYIGRASVAVPGFVAGLCTLLEERGTLPLAEVLQPAIRFAREGVVLSESLAYVLDILLPIFTYTPELAALFTRNGEPYRAGDRLRFPQLARTLERLAEEGPSLFYTGEVAQAIVADQEAHGGLLTAQDLAGYRVERREPVEISYRGETLLVPPPPSSGGVLVAFALELLAAFPVGTLPHNHTEHIRLLAETMRHTTLARADWDRDARPLHERIRWFLSEEHVATYREKLRSALTRPPVLSTPLESGHPHTTHISVADEHGLIVSMTTTSGENAGFLVGDTGVSLNNMLGEQDLHPLGFHRLPPGMRLPSMMTPTVILEEGKPRLATGSGGSTRIRSTILQVLSNVLDFHFPLEDAVNAPRVHFEADVLQLEGGIAPEVVRELETLGYRVNPWPERHMYFGGAHTIARTARGFEGAGDRRRGGSVGLVEDA